MRASSGVSIAFADEALSFPAYWRADESSRSIYYAFRDIIFPALQKSFMPFTPAMSR